jgi:DNA repair protein SbcD/Mre11
MKIVHFSDTHLGYQAFDNVTDAGVNAREQDVYDAFERAIDRILEIGPDLVLHSGDFFHRPSPSNRALTFGLEQLRRICNANIPFVVIAGNHETPKTVYNSPILRAFRSLDGSIFPVFGEALESFECGEALVHALPHINDLRALHGELEKLTPRPGYFNILMLHTSLGKHFLMEEYGEQVFPAAFEPALAGFDYVALGHWHKYQNTKVAPNAWYSGSTERMSEAEAGEDKGLVVLTIRPDRTYDLQFEPLETRSWLRIEISKCHNKSVEELEAEIERARGNTDARGAIVSLNLNDIKLEQTLELGNLRLRALFPECFQLLVRRRSWSDRGFVRNIEANQFERLDKIFGDYIRDKYPDDPALAEQLAARAEQYFQTQQP